MDVYNNKYAVLYNGLEYENLKFLRKKEKQLKKAQRKLSKKKKRYSGCFKSKELFLKRNLSFPISFYRNTACQPAHE